MLLGIAIGIGIGVGVEVFYIVLSLFMPWFNRCVVYKSWNSMIGTMLPILIILAIIFSAVDYPLIIGLLIGQCLALGLFNMTKRAQRIRATIGIDSNTNG